MFATPQTPGVVYSIVIPVFNEAEVLPVLYGRLNAVMSALGQSCEILFVNDGSSDDSLAQLWNIRAQDPQD